MIDDVGRGVLARLSDFGFERLARRLIEVATSWQMLLLVALVAILTLTRTYSDSINSEVVDDAQPG